MDIERIKNNAKQIQIFLDDCVNYSNPILIEVYGNLQQTRSPSFPVDPRQAFVLSVLEKAYGLLMDQVGAPNVLAILLGLSQSYVDYPPPSLAHDFASIAERFRMTFQQMRSEMAAIYDDPLANAAKSYKLPFPLPGTGATVFSVRDMQDSIFPEYGSGFFNTLLLSFNQFYRQQVTRIEMKAHFKVGFAYFVAQPQTDLRNPEVDGRLQMRDWWWTKAPSNTGNSLRSRVPERSFGWPDQINNVGSNGSRPFFEATCRAFYEKHPGMYIFICDDDSDGWLGYLQYVLVGLQVPYGSSRWTLFSSPSKDEALTLDHWLFIDDGFGNVVNPDAVAMRQDVFMHWDLVGSKGIRPQQSVQGPRPSHPM